MSKGMFVDVLMSVLNTRLKTFSKRTMNRKTILEIKGVVMDVLRNTFEKSSYKIDHIAMEWTANQLLKMMNVSAGVAGDGLLGEQIAVNDYPVTDFSTGDITILYELFNDVEGIGDLLEPEIQRRKMLS